MTNKYMKKIFKNKKTKITTIIFVVVAIIGLGIWQFYAEPKINLFNESKITDNFRNMKKIFPSRNISKSENPKPFKENIKSLEIEYKYNNNTSTLDDFLNRSKTNGFLVIKDEKIVYEKYFNGYKKDDRATSFSVIKSFISTLVGIAIDEKLIDNVNDPITKYLPELKGSGYDNVPIKDILQMSSGVDFTEDYKDTNTDAFKIYDRMFLFLEPVEKIVKTYPSKIESGKKFEYASLNTLALGLLVSKVNGKDLSLVFQEKLWSPLGMESDAYTLLDMHGTEVSFWGLNATLRDFAKLGQLFANNGMVDDRQIVSSEWIAEATTPDKSILQPGQIDKDWGYQYQWWIPKGSTGDFSAIGIWGQFIYVNPENNVVIVKTSADKDFKNHEYEAMVLFKIIAESL